MTTPASTTCIAVPAEGYGLVYAIRTARAWWYPAWLRSLAGFRRTYLGSFWLGLSNLPTASLLALVYGTVFCVQDPIHYALYLGYGGMIALSQCHHLWALGHPFDGGS